MNITHFASIEKNDSILSIKNVISDEKAKFVGSILYNIEYKPFCLIKNYKKWDCNPCHYKKGNDLMVLEGFYEDEENHIMYFYLRNTTVAREYNKTDDEFPETYYLLAVNGKEL